MTIRLYAASLADRGRERSENQDRVYEEIWQSSAEEPLGLFIVADGMGGHMAGEKAAELTIQVIRRELRDLFMPHDPSATVVLSQEELRADAGATVKLSETSVEEKVRAAIQLANSRVRGLAHHKPAEAADTGSTVTMAVVQGATAIIANVGDSRTYLFRQGRLKPLTRDHSLVASLVAAGQLTPDEIYTHPQRNMIYRSLGQKPSVDVDLFRQRLQPGDRLLLCSDGLWEMVRDPQIAAVLRGAENPSLACRRLVKAANDNGGEDNIGVVVVHVGGDGDSA